VSLYGAGEINPARPAPGAALIALAEIAEPGARAVEFTSGEARFSVIVARAEGQVRAYENVCPHARAPLDRPDGRVPVQEKRFLVCSAHGASFRIEDGRCVGGPGLGMGLKAFPVKVREGVVYAA
jgi:nitrite reductase/ring-hydroxylating ferredoxin subunit